MEVLLKKHNTTKGFIDRFWDNLLKAGKDNLTQTYMKARLTLLETYWQKFEDGHYQLHEYDTTNVKEVQDYLRDDVYTRTENIYIATKTRILAALKDEGKSDPANATSSFLKQIQLPKINLPNFSGDQLTWESFRDLFRSLVGDVPGLAPVQKLQYLKASLTGEAAAVVANIGLTDKGYETAWSELVARYDNKRVLLGSHMRAFLSSPPATKPSGAELKRLSSAALQARRSFESLGRPVSHWDDWFVHVVVEKLDSSSRLLWEASLQTSSEFPTLTKLQDFLQTRIRALEAATPRTVPTTTTASAKQQERKTKVNSLTTSTAGSSKRGRKCSVCQGNHLFNYCTQFKELTVSQRREHVKKQGACFNCLKDKHSVSNCPSGFRCARCQGKHHTLLHLAENSSAVDSETTAKTQVTDNSAATGSTSTDSSVNANVVVHALATKGAVLLSTAEVSCSNRQGDSLVVRALLDSGSEATFVTERVARALRLPRGRVHVPVTGIQGASAGVASHSVELIIGSPRDPSLRHNLTSVLVLPKLTSALPSQAVRRGDWPHLTGLELADPHFDRPAPVEAVLGADVYGLLLREGLRRGHAGSPSAQATTLGWVLMGHTSTASPSPGISAFHAMASPTDVDRTLQRFWELEEVPTEPILGPEEQRCERLFATTHARDPHGRYIVRLPKRSDSVVRLKNNRKEALQQLIGIERRLMRNALLREQYNTFMDEYHRLGHMVSIQANEVHSEDAYYMPHHAVFKRSGPVDKIRVVFNASHRTSSGLALNDLLLPGPKLQSELWIILTRWRLYPYAFTSDIVKMFRQILVSSEDTDLQRILWRADPAQEIQDYRLVTVVYGTASAPYLALRTLLQLADDEGPKYPLGADAIRNHSYVDDLLAGGHTLEQALEVRRQLTAILAAGGFSLSKWAASTPQLCPDDESHDKLFHDREGVSTLGVLWRPADDTLALRVASATSTTSYTKRTVLSDVARFFDPLGWASPVLIFGKIFIQDLWMAGLDWDEPLPDQLQSRWTKFTDTLPELNALSIPRFAHLYGAESAELHGFSDASCRAYAAAVYLRSTSPSGVIFTHLLVAKTKVAPVKQISIPRLELCGALLLARLICCTLKGLPMENIPIYAWTDAAVALAWIRGHPARWETFVANRVTKIQSLVSPQHWRYVPTTDNPADAATRGIEPLELAALELWWAGPPWLAWPGLPTTETSPPTDGLEEQESRAVVVDLARPADEDNDFLARYSSTLKLLRITALCFRFFDHARRNPRKTGFLSRDELEAARIRWVRVAQRGDFSEEISRLERDRPLPARSPLLPLRPILDEQGLLRVGGRLQHALLPFAEKHPLILQKSSRLSLLLVREAHATSLHGGPQLTRSLLLRRYWILQANSLVRSVIHACVRCARFRATTAEQQMGQLPAERARPSRPFQSTGVDYAGPIPLRTWKGRGHKAVKGYICLFICLSSKAVHLEPVSDLSTVSFLAAFRRFTARRGHCELLLSDNGTNFRGAAQELRSMFRAAADFYKECATSLANSGTKWSFIPPGAPHFGGLWEAGVKSVKYHLRRIIGDTSLTYEEMATLLAQIEACLNSRPLYPLSNSPTDLSALTPGHLILGEPPVNIPEPSRANVDVKRLTSRWALTSAMRDHFWKRWSSEYVHHLQQLRKWPKRAPNVKIGGLVLLRNELQPPTKWALARIVALHPGPDGLTRVVSVRTANATFKRPITKIVPLPIEPQTEPERESDN